MITSAFRLRVKGINFMPNNYNLRVHSIYHPLAFDPKGIDREKALTNFNIKLESHLKTLMGHLNKTGLSLFTGIEERVRQNIQVIEQKLLNFICN